MFRVSRGEQVAMSEYSEISNMFQQRDPRHLHSGCYASALRIRRLTFATPLEETRHALD